MVFKNRRKRLRVSTSEDEASEEVGEFGAENSQDSDFEAFPSCTPSQHESVPIREISIGQSSSQDGCQSLVDKYSSVSCQHGLAVSARKAAEIRKWMSEALMGSCPRLLILSGPPGCGKSSAIETIAEEMQCPVFSWQAPAVGGRNVSLTLLDDFRSFLVGNRYPTLLSDDTALRQANRKVLMVEDIPICATDIAQKRAMLQKVFGDLAVFAQHPTVVIISDSDKGVARTAKFMFGRDLLESSSVVTIRVPPVTDAMMKRRLIGVMREERISHRQDELNRAIALAHGDIRAALNALQFCWNAYGTHPPVPGHFSRTNIKLASGRRRNEGTRYDSSILSALGQDMMLGMYHAVSKILNNKRDANGISKYNAEDLLEDARAEPVSVLEFLHHNYLEFFGDIEDVVDALDCLSHADCLLPWRQDHLSRTGLWDCAASVATRGFLFHNLHPVQSGWRPIRGPESYEIAKEGRDHVSNARYEFSSILAPAIYTQSTLCETVPLGEQITKSRIKAWGSMTETLHTPNVAANCADLVTGEMRSAKTEIGTHAGLISKLEIITDPSKALDVDPIVEWD